MYASVSVTDDSPNFFFSQAGQDDTGEPRGFLHLGRDTTLLLSYAELERLDEVIADAINDLMAPRHSV